MSDLFENNYAEKVPETELRNEDDSTWYIPHHRVYHPKNPEKFLVILLRIYLFAGKDVSPAQLSSVVVVKIRVLDDRERRKVNVKAILILNLIRSFLLCELPGEVILDNWHLR